MNTISFISNNQTYTNSTNLALCIKTKDKICSSYINFENPKHVDIDGLYFGSLIVINYSREMEPIFLDKIASLDLDIQLSIFYEKKNSYEIIKELTYNIGNTGATMKTSSCNQQDVDVMGSKYQDAKYIRKQLQLGEENLYYLNIYIGCFSNDVESLETSLQRIESVAISSGLNTIRANFREEQALKSIIPFLNPDKNIETISARNVLTSGLASTYPFISNELFDKRGVLIGTNSFDKSVIMLDRFDSTKYKNPNMFVVGTSGSGKSYFIKLMINRNRFLNISQFVIDPDREYSSLCQKISGTLVNFGASQTINVMDIREVSLDLGESFLRNKISKLNVFFSMILEGINEEEKGELEVLLMKCYEKYGITEDNSSLLDTDSKSVVLGRKTFRDSENMPTLKDVYELIRKSKKLKKYSSVLKQYVTGSMGYLSQKTSVNLDSKLIVVDIHDVSEAQMPIVMFIVTDYFWDVIQKDRNEKKILYLDEVWKMINKNEYTADFVYKLFKTIRKYGGAATAITQDISDFFMLEEGKYGKGILNNSSIKCIFQLEETDLSVLDKSILISEEERYKILNMKRGTAIIHAGRNNLMVDIISSPKEHEYVNTDIKED